MQSLFSFLPLKFMETRPQNIPTKEDYKGYVASMGPRACYDESKRMGKLFATFIASIMSKHIYYPTFPKTYMGPECIKMTIE